MAPDGFVGAAVEVLDIAHMLPLAETKHSHLGYPPAGVFHI